MNMLPLLFHCKSLSDDDRSLYWRCTKIMTSESIALSSGDAVDERWLIQRKVGEGSYGAVYEVKDNHGKITAPLALKLESTATAKEDKVLKVEVALLFALAKHPKHVCTLYEVGRNDHYCYMVMSMLGPSLSVLKKHVPRHQYSMSTAVRIYYQCIECVREIHQAGWIHRDIKPGNFTMGKTHRRRVYIIDFGLARRFARKKPNEDGTLAVRKKRERAGFRGTQTYCSINAHKRVEVGRHDDLISVFYTFGEMAAGALPWDKLEEDSEVMDSKIKYGARVFKDVSPALVEMFGYMQLLNYEDTPDYNKLLTIIDQIINTKKYRGQAYDWEKDNSNLSKFWDTEQLPLSDD